MVDLLPAGVISHGVYGGSQFVQNAPNGAKNSFGVMHPGSPLSFQYETAMVGAGYISCQGRRVCGATMTNDGFGRWSVPSAKDMADVLNMMTASNQSYHQYFDMSLDKVFEMICALQKEVRSLKGGAAPAPGSFGGCGCGMGHMGQDFAGNDVVQGRVVDGTGGPRTTTRAHSADRTAATRRAPPGVAPDMAALENDVQELKRKFGMNMPADPNHGGGMCDGKATMAKSAADTAKTTTPGAGWDWRAKTSATPGPHPTEPPAPGAHPCSFDRRSSAAVPAMGATQTPAKPEMSQTTPRAAPWNRQVSPPAPSEPQHGSRPSPWSRPAPTTHTAPEPPLPGQRAETPMQQRQPPPSGAPTSPGSPAKTGGAGGYKTQGKANLEDGVEVANLTAELDRCMMMRQVSAQSAGGASLSNVPCALNGRAVTDRKSVV